jgi:DNA primase
MTQIDEIKARIDIVDLIGETVKLRRSGRNYAGLCPFHSEKTPSFMVSPERQTWHCFGQCNEGGDIFKFVMKKEGWDFGEALRYLAQRAGVQLEEYHARRPEEKEEYARLRQALEEAATYFRHQLLNTDEGRPALAYLREKRRLTDAAIETFGLGYAPRGWDNLLKHLTARGYSEQELADCGLVSVREQERDTGTPEYRRMFDRFRERIIIPIRDADGKMAGFGARILKPDDFPKFLNSPETPLFSKSRILYGFDRARKAIRAAGRAVIVEGYFDVIALHQAGFENVVSPMGTALTEDQLRLLKRATQNIVLALDPDAAGQKAVFTGLEAARQALDRETETAFDARGLLRHVARLQADLRVAVMPDELDPDEIVQRDPAEWERLIASARPIVIHVMHALAEGRDLADAGVKSEIAARVLPLIEELPDPVERDAYRQQLARFLRVDERSLIGAPARGPRPKRPRPQAEEPAPLQEEQPSAGIPSALSGAHRVEAHLLGLLLRRPDLLYRLDRALQENGLGRAVPEDFGYTDHQLLFRLVRESLEQDSADPDRYLLETLPGPLAGLAGSLLEDAASLDPVDERLLEDLFRSLLALRRRIVNENINQLRYLMEEDPLMAENYRQMVLQNTRLRQLLDRARLTRNGIG